MYTEIRVYVIYWYNFRRVPHIQWKLYLILIQRYAVNVSHSARCQGHASISKILSYRKDSFYIERMPSISEQKSTCKNLSSDKKKLLMCFLHKFFYLSFEHVMDRFDGVFCFDIERMLRYRSMTFMIVDMTTIISCFY